MSLMIAYALIAYQNEVEITYVVTDFTTLPKETFSGALEYVYDSTIRINISNVDRAKEWLQSLMKHSM